MQNFQSIVDAFLRADAAVQVADEKALEQAFRILLRDAARREAVAERALQVVRENKGAIDRTVDMIVEHLKEEDIYVAPAPARA
jgi:3-deoxy-D-manno-octulosonic-acid transferase